MSKIAMMYDKWMKAEHVRGAIVARVRMAEIATFDGKNGKESKYVLHFYEKSLKPLSLNKSNAQAMADLTGTDDEAQWTNAVVMLTPSKLANGNGTIILSAPPAQSAPMAPLGKVQESEDSGEVPF